MYRIHEIWEIEKKKQKQKTYKLNYVASSNGRS
jgi:hypothetical protein